MKTRARSTVTVIASAGAGAVLPPTSTAADKREREKERKRNDLQITTSDWKIEFALLEAPHHLVSILVKSKSRLGIFSIKLEVYC